MPETSNLVIVYISDDGIERDMTNSPWRRAIGMFLRTFRTRCFTQIKHLIAKVGTFHKVNCGSTTQNQREKEGIIISASRREKLS